MSVLVDTNVMLDIALRREPFLQSSALALAKARQAGTTLLCATSVTTLHYFLRQKLGELGARKFLRECLLAMPVAGVNQPTLQNALDGAMNDFEDSVIAQAALAASAQWILTRNPTDFNKSPVAAITPENYLKLP